MQDAAKHALKDNHIEDLNVKITDLSKALATLGRGTTMAELLRIIHFEDFTTPAEFAMLTAMLDHMQDHLRAFDKLQLNTLQAANLVTTKG
ncbi:MAG: hypothetical protein EOO38_27140, partial [Cytophagaceae bacterium]